MDVVKITCLGAEIVYHYCRNCRGYRPVTSAYDLATITNDPRIEIINCNDCWEASRHGDGPPLDAYKLKES